MEKDQLNLLMWNPCKYSSFPPLRTSLFRLSPSESQLLPPYPNSSQPLLSIILARRYECPSSLYENPFQLLSLFPLPLVRTLLPFPAPSSPPHPLLPLPIRPFPFFSKPSDYGCSVFLFENLSNSPVEWFL